MSVKLRITAASTAPATLATRYVAAEYHAPRGSSRKRTAMRGSTRCRTSKISTLIAAVNTIAASQ